jgi:hypothetical protein
MSRNFFIGLILIAVATSATRFWLTRQDSPADERATRITQPENKDSASTEAQPMQAAPNISTISHEDSTESLEITGAEAAAIAGLDVHALTNCHRQVLKQTGIARMNCDHVDEKDAAGRSQCSKQQAFLRAQLEQATAAAAPCPGSLAHPSTYYQAVRKLAKGGDVVAQRCFIQGYFGIDRELGINLSQAELDEYPNLARKFIDAGIARGDWSIVRWLSKPRVEFPDFLLASAHPMGLDDRVNAYKIRRLLMLGGQAGLGTLEQYDPARLVEYWRREEWLSPEQLEEAENWAQTMYQQHFIGSREGAAIGQADFCAGY